MADNGKMRICAERSPWARSGPARRAPERVRPAGAAWRISLAAAAVGLCAGAAGAPAQANWHRPDATCRRRVTVERTPRTDLPGCDVAVLTMPTGGLTRPDGRDVAVVAADGSTVARRILRVGPGDRMHLALALRPGQRAYHVYFGGPAVAPPPELDLRRGVLHEMWALVGGRLATEEHARAAARRARKGPLLGRELTRGIHLAGNPFGPANRVVSVFTAHVVCPVGGRYIFACAGRNTTVLEVDGETVTAGCGRHRVLPYERNYGYVDLAAGLHRLTVLHVSDSGPPVVAAAWMRPDRDELELIRPGAFAPFAEAQVGPIERRDGAANVDFFPCHEAEACLDGRYFQRYRFRAIAVGAAGEAFRWQWRFGDGQHADGAEAEHVYLRPGEYAVTLIGSGPGGTCRRTHRIAVSRPWRRLGTGRRDGLGDCAAVVSRYDFAALSPAAAGEAVDLMWRTRRADETLAACRAVLDHPDATGRAVERALDVYVRSIRAAGGRADRVVAAMLSEARRTPRPAAAAAMLVRAAGIYLDHGRLDEALCLFEHVLAQPAALARAGLIRRARAGAGDVWRLRGDRKRAAAAFAPLRSPQVGPMVDFRRGDFARTAEAHLWEGRLDDAEVALDRWGMTFPLDKLDGFWSLIRVRLLLARRRWAAAAREARALLAVRPDAPAAAELLMLAGQASWQLDRADQAASAWRRIVRDYPESAFAPLAADNLKLARRP